MDFNITLFITQKYSTMVGQGNLPSTWITKFSSRITTCLSNVHNGYGHPLNLNVASRSVVGGDAAALGARLRGGGASKLASP